MTQFPEWVPDSVLSFYKRRDLDDITDKIDISKFSGIERPSKYFRLLEFPGIQPPPETRTGESYELGFQLLQITMASKELEKVWNAIDKRSASTSPDIVARVIVQLPTLLGFFDVWDSSRANACAKLVKSIDRALETYRQENGFGYAYEKEVLKNIDLARSYVNFYNETWDRLQKYVGQRNSVNAKRTYLVRLLAEIFKHIYGTPLYETVGAIAGVILDEEPISSDHVRKLVQSG